MNPTPTKILLVAGPKDHGPSEHDYPLWQKRWSTLLALADGVSGEQADGWPTVAQWSAADVAVFYSANPQWAAAVDLLPQAKIYPQAASWRKARLVLGDGFFSLFQPLTPTASDAAQILDQMDTSLQELLSK